MTRLQGILAAGGLTGIVAATSVAIGLKDVVLAANNAPVPAPMVQSQSDSTLDPALQAAIEARDQQYQAQLEAANQAIQQLQAERDALARQAGAASRPARSGEFEHEGGDD